MGRQALLLVAAVSLYFSTTAQQTHFFPKLSLVKTYDVANLNKTFGYTSAISKEKLEPSSTLIYAPLSPQLKLKDLHQQLGSDLRYLRIEKRNKEFQGAFQGLMQGATNKGKPGL